MESANFGQGKEAMNSPFHNLESNITIPLSLKLDSDQLEMRPKRVYIEAERTESPSIKEIADEFKFLLQSDKIIKHEWSDE